MAISGWDLLDSLLESLPLAIPVLVLAEMAVKASAISSDQALLAAGFFAALQFAYNMNQLQNPRKAPTGN